MSMSCWKNPHVMTQDSSTCQLISNAVQSHVFGLLRKPGHPHEDKEDVQKGIETQDFLVEQRCCLVMLVDF